MVRSRAYRPHITQVNRGRVQVGRDGVGGGVSTLSGCSHSYRHLLARRHNDRRLFLSQTTVIDTCQQGPITTGVCFCHSDRPQL